MKIFSNFDTQFRQKLLKKKKTQFPESDILLIRRSSYYFILWVFFPFCILLGIAGTIYVFLIPYPFFKLALFPLGLVWIIIVWVRIGHKCLKYFYDFTLVDPQWVTSYKQKGILHSHLKQIPAKRIRSIEFERSSLLENIFEYGKIDIHTDFTQDMHIGEDDESPSVIGLTYVDSPFKIKTRITDICFKND